MSDELPKLRIRSTPPENSVPPPPPPGMGIPAASENQGAPAAWLSSDVPAFPEISRHAAAPEFPPLPPAVPPPPLGSDEEVMPAPPAGKPKMVLRPRLDAPVDTAAPPLVAPPPAPLVFVAKATGKPPPSPALVQAGKKVQRAALGIGALGAAVFTIAGYVAYQNLVVEARAGTHEFQPLNRTSKTPSAAEPIAAKVTAPAPPQIPPPAPVEETVLAETKPAAPDLIHVSVASRSFQAWVNNLKITGIRSGERPRIVVARKLYNLGETMDVELGITFEGYDAERHAVRFKDRSGFVLEREDR